MGWHEWPLMLFTVLGQVAVGGFIVLGFSLMRKELIADERRSILKGMFFVWVLLGIGFLASTFHLGSPGRAFNALNRIGSSGLSNEVALGVLFFAAGGLYWLLAVAGKMPAGANLIWLVIAMALGLGFVYTMVGAYKIPTVLTWNNGYTLTNFFMTVLIGGPLLGYLLKRGGCECGAALLATISLAALIVSVCSNLMQAGELAGIRSSVMQASVLAAEFGRMMSLRVALAAIGLGLWIVPMLKGGRPNNLLLAAGLLLVIAGEVIGRGAFYGLHMTVGVTYGG